MRVLGPLGQLGHVARKQADHAWLCGTTFFHHLGSRDHLGREPTPAVLEHPVAQVVQLCLGVRITCSGALRPPLHRGSTAGGDVRPHALVGVALQLVGHGLVRLAQLEGVLHPPRSRVRRTLDAQGDQLGQILLAWVAVVVRRFPTSAALLGLLVPRGNLGLRGSVDGAERVVVQTTPAGAHTGGAIEAVNLAASLLTLLDLALGHGCFVAVGADSGVGHLAVVIHLQAAVGREHLRVVDVLGFLPHARGGGHQLNQLVQVVAPDDLGQHPGESRVDALVGDALDHLQQRLAAGLTAQVDALLQQLVLDCWVQGLYECLRGLAAEVRGVLYALFGLQ